MRSGELNGAAVVRGSNPVDKFLMDVAEYAERSLANNPLVVGRLETLLMHQQSPEITFALDAIERAAVIVRVVHRGTV